MTAPAPSTTARIDADIAGAQRRLVEARAFRTELDQLRGRASSRDRSVTVTVDATGLVLGIEFADPLPPARDLRQVVLDTIRAAQRDVAATVSTTARDRFGESSPLVARLDDELSTRFAPRDPDGTAIDDHGREQLGRGGRWLR